jgi:23S rRNA pseudouridine2605 synthase
VFELLKHKLPRVISVGRLDLNSEGLLLLTNSSNIAHAMESPNNNIERVYLVRAYGDAKRLDFQSQSIVIEGITYSPKSIKFIRQVKSNSWFEVVLTEGKNREIRKIFEHFGLKVSRLLRTKYGKYELGSLKAGEYREVNLY